MLKTETSTHPPLRTGPHFSFSYALTEFLGRGFSSQVYRGRSNITGFPLAVKIIDSSLLKQLDKKLIVSEITSMRKVRGKSPYVLNLIEVSEKGTNVFIVTEQCDFDLTRVLHQGPLIERQAVETMEEIIKGYLCIASHGIVHRDLKPANIFLKNNHVKLGDFGFAISFEECKSCHNVGSPLYMSPEALQYTQYSFASDIWSLGIIYFEMLFGGVPWDAETEAQLLEKILTVPIEEVLKDKVISQNSALFLVKALNPNPQLRMTVRELETFTLRTLRLVSSMYLSHSREERSLHPNKVINDVDRSEIFKALNSQILLCEFLLQLLQNLRHMPQDKLHSLKRAFSRFVEGRVHLIKASYSQNPFRISRLEEFRNTSEFYTVMESLSSFEERLGKALEVGDTDILSSPPNYKELKEQIMNIITGLFLDFSSKSSAGIMLTTQRKFLLDNLVIAYDLLRVASLDDILAFSKSTNIQQSLQQIRASPLANE